MTTTQDPTITQDVVDALALMVAHFANRPGLFGLLRGPQAKRNGWTRETVIDMESVAEFAIDALARHRAAAARLEPAPVELTDAPFPSHWR